MFHLPQIAQMNFLILLTRVYRTIPHKCLLEFIQTLLSCPIIKNGWIQFYLRQLLNLATSNSCETADDNQDKAVLKTGLSSATVNRLRGFCSQQFPSSVEAIKVVSVSHTEEQSYEKHATQELDVEGDENTSTGLL